MITRISRWIASQLLRRINNGSLLVHEGGLRVAYGSGEPSASVYVNSSRLWPMLLGGTRGMAEAFARNQWDSPDLVSVIRVGARNAHRFDRARRRVAPVTRPAQRAATAFRPRTVKRARRDIAAHYDLGNELFARMLDPTMTYSCAVFERPGMTLEQAQVAKYERICQRLELTRTDHVIEIGGGWGGYALYAARTRGCHVTTTTISREQYQWALERVERADLRDHITVLMQDYRELRGRYDALVSVEMIEAVGWRALGTFLRRCGQLLVPTGAMLLQAITTTDAAYEVEKTSRSFMNTYIFPGGCLPSLEAISRELAAQTDLRVVGLDDLTPHYVETLRRWRANFTANADSLARLGYDDRFIRIWTLYLAYCQAGFAERRISDVQLLAVGPRSPLANVDRGASRVDTDMRALSISP